MTISIKIRNGITFSNEIESLDKISSVNHPIALGVICANIAEIIIIIIIIINLIFCFLSNNLYIFFKTFDKLFFFIFTPFNLNYIIYYNIKLSKTPIYPNAIFFYISCHQALLITLISNNLFRIPLDIFYQF